MACCSCGVNRQLATQPELQRRFQHGGGREKLILSLKAVTGGTTRPSTPHALGVGKDFFRRSGRDHSSLIYNVCTAANPESLAYIMVGDEHADVAGS